MPLEASQKAVGERNGVGWYQGSGQRQTLAGGASESVRGWKGKDMPKPLNPGERGRARAQEVHERNAARKAAQDVEKRAAEAERARLKAEREAERGGSQDDPSADDPADAGSSA
jgi:hypothetical protein